MGKIINCNSNGMIDVKDIINGVNGNNDFIEDSIAYTDTVKKLTEDNKSYIKSVENRVIAIENSTPAGQDEVDALKADVKKNETNIGANSAKITAIENEAIVSNGKIAKNEADIADIDMRVTDNESNIGSMRTDIGRNSFAVDDHEKRIASVEAVLGSGASNDFLSTFTVNKGIGGGNAAPNTWVQRNIGTEIVNGISAVSSGTSVTLQDGSYMVYAIASATGENQSRLNIGGSNYIYGTHCSGTGQSIIVASITLPSPTSISIETMVASSSGDDTLGKKSTISSDIVFLTLYIRKQS